MKNIHGPQAFHAVRTGSFELCDTVQTTYLSEPQFTHLSVLNRAHLLSPSLPLVFLHPTPAALTFWGASFPPGSLPPLGLCTCYSCYPAHFFLIVSPLGSCHPLDLGSSIISLRSLTAETTGSNPSLIDHVSPHLSLMQICMHSCDNFTRVYFLHWTISS